MASGKATVAQERPKAVKAVEVPKPEPLPATDDEIEELLREVKDEVHEYAVPAEGSNERHGVRGLGSHRHGKRGTRKAKVHDDSGPSESGANGVPSTQRGCPRGSGCMLKRGLKFCNYCFRGKGQVLEEATE